MPLIHNQINKLWFNPSYKKFKASSFVKQVFTQRESEDFIRTGAYLITEAHRFSEISIPWREDKRLEILKNPRLENALFSLGSEYLLKGIFLHKGYAINKPLKGVTIKNSPILIKGNKSKLNPSEVFELYYIKNNVRKIVDFQDFDDKQNKKELEEKEKMKGQKLAGITRMTIPYPTSDILLDYILFKRNYSLHRPFIMPEFKGLTDQLYDFLNYIAQKTTGKSINKLARFKV